MLLWLGFFIRFYKEENEKKSVYYFLGCVISVFFAIGMNEMFLALNIVISIFILSFLIHTKTTKILTYTPIFLVIISSSFFFISNPGIGNRFSMFEESRLDFSIYTILYKGLTDYFISLKNSTLNNPIFFIFIFVVYLKLVQNNIRVKLLTYKNYLAVLAIYFIATFSMLSAYYLPTGFEYGIPHRIYTSVWLVSQLFFSVFFVHILLGLNLSFFRNFSN
jgi:hypothetical protein